MAPEIKSPLILQGGSAALADAAYCHARQHQALSAAGDPAAARALEKRWRPLEIPLLLLCLLLRPTQSQAARGMASSVAPIYSVATCFELYCARWLKPPADGGLDAAPDALIGLQSGFLASSSGHSDAKVQPARPRPVGQLLSKCTAATIAHIVRPSQLLTRQRAAFRNASECCRSRALALTARPHCSPWPGSPLGLHNCIFVSDGGGC